MKKLLLIFCTLFFCTALAWAENDALSWEQPAVGPDVTVVGYVVYFWDDANPDRKYRYVTDGTQVPDIGDTLHLTPGNTYAFVVVPYTMPNVPVGTSEPLVWQYGDGLLLENDLPIRIYIPGPVIISVEPQ